MGKHNVPKGLQEILAQLPANAWSIDDGGKHRKIKVNGRMVGVLPFSRVVESSSGMRNVLSQVRRAVQEYQKSH